MPAQGVMIWNECLRPKTSHGGRVFPKTSENITGDSPTMARVRTFGGPVSGGHRHSKERP